MLGDISSYRATKKSEGKQSILSYPILSSKYMIESILCIVVVVWKYVRNKVWRELNPTAC